MVITSASNIRCGDNPAYTLDDFLDSIRNLKI